MFTQYDLLIVSHFDIRFFWSYTMVPLKFVICGICLLITTADYEMSSYE